MSVSLLDKIYFCDIEVARAMGYNKSVVKFVIGGIYEKINKLFSTLLILCIVFSSFDTIYFSASEIGNVENPISKEEAKGIIEENSNDDSLQSRENLLNQVQDNETIIEVGIDDTSSYSNLSEINENTDAWYALNDFSNVRDSHIVNNHINTVYEGNIDGIKYSVYVDEHENVIFQVANKKYLLIQNDFIEVVVNDYSPNARASYSLVSKKYVESTDWQKYLGASSFVDAFLPGIGTIISVVGGGAVVIGSFIQVRQYGIEFNYKNTSKSCMRKKVTDWYGKSSRTPSSYIKTKTSYYQTTSTCYLDYFKV